MKFGGRKKKMAPQSSAPPVDPAPPFYAPPDGFAAPIDQMGFAATCANMKLPPEARGSVKGLQMFLNKRGLGPLTVDGICGYNTFSAWQKWQQAKTRMGTVQTQPATPPSGPGLVPVLRPTGVLVPFPAPVAVAVPFWKKPVFIAAAAVIVVLILTRKK